MLPSYYEAVRPLPDDQRLILYDAIMDYAFTDKEPENLSPILNGYFVLLRPNIDSSTKKYSASVENGKKGGRPRKQTQQKPSKNPTETTGKPSRNQEKEKEMEMEKEMEKESTEVPPAAAAPTPIAEPSDYGFGPELTAAFSDWLTYKREKKQGYKPTGLKSLVTQVRKNAEQYGEAAVVDLMRLCMSNGWQGIIWDKLHDRKKTDHVRAASDYESGDDFFSR